MTEFTIVLPTTGDRGSTLEQVLPMVLLQSVTDWELFVIGDGIDAYTRDVLQSWCARDSRLRLFDHPKHERRGEVYRHQALQQARGRLVAYLTDRDLWLHDHLANLHAALAGHDFAHTNSIHITPEGKPRTPLQCDLSRASQRRQIETRGSLPVAMSCIGHRLDCYQRLPWGWRTTPRERKTDHYMWHQFLREGQASARSLRWPTVAYFQRGDHPGWPSAQRAAELARWRERLATPALQDAWRAQAMRSLGRPLTRLQAAWRSWLFFHRGVRDRYLRLRRFLASRPGAGP